MLYALCGLPFAGKSTMAERMARLTGAAVIRLDEINHKFGVGLEGAAISADEWQRTYDEAYRRIAQHPVAGAQIQFIYVPVSTDEAHRGLLVNRQTRARYDARDDNFELAVSIFEPPDGEHDVVHVEHPGPELAWLVRLAHRTR